MNQMVGFLVYHLLRGEPLPLIEAWWNQAHGIPPPGIWADAVVLAYSSMTATANLLNAPMGATIGSLLPPAQAGQQTVTVRVTVGFDRPGSVGTFYRPFDRLNVPVTMTVGELWADLLTAAATLAAQSDAVVHSIDIIPPLI